MHPRCWSSNVLKHLGVDLQPKPPFPVYFVMFKLFYAWTIC